MRRLAVVAAITAGLLLTPAAPALALGQPHRPSGSFTPIAPSDNGGDNGFGNCGHNSSGGVPPLDGGNGGLAKVATADGCVSDEDAGDGGGIN